MAEQRDNLNLSGRLDVRLSFVGDIFRGITNCNGTQFHGGNFKNTVFEGPATFNSAKFYSGADFTGAVFKDHADFENAEFYGGKVDFSGAVFLAGASFKNTKFGNPYKRDFGEWEIRFSLTPPPPGNGLCSLETRKIGEVKGKWIKVADFPISSEPEFPALLRAFEIRTIPDEIAKAFREFRTSPQSVSFASCRFGEIKIDDFSEEEIKKIIVEATGGISSLSEPEKTLIMADRSKRLEPEMLREQCQYKKDQDEKNQAVNFTGTFFYPQMDVDFKKALFFNGRHVEFNFARFGNSGDVGFDSACFSNGGDVGFRLSSFGNSGGVWFHSPIFSNGGDVEFSSATFANGGFAGFNSAVFGNVKNVRFIYVTFGNDGNVGFDSTTFGNDEDIFFDSTRFNNSGSVQFSSASFSNGGYVGFDSAIFSNKEKVDLSKIVWMNDGNLNFSIKEFREMLSLKFDECLFLCGGDIFFKEARFPEKGSTMFQRCYFGRTPLVDFTGTFFRHTSFEGGDISWLKKKDKTPEQILRERMGKKYDDLSPETKKELNTRTTPVFEEGTTVLWKDLTTESAKNLTLRRVNLSHSIFDGMTLSHIQLNAPEWFTKKEKWCLFFKENRRVLFEETIIEHDYSNLRNIEDQYTQLKNNLEKQGNYLNAGYFHYGEQEIRKKILELENKKRFLPSFPLFLAQCYKWFSGYGERPWRALVSTLVMAFLFSLVLAALNINTDIKVLLSQEEFFEKGVAKLFKSFAEVITPLSWSFSWKETATSWVEFWAKLTFIKGLRLFFLVVFQVFLLGIQLPLLVLAVRRRFKR